MNITWLVIVLLMAIAPWIIKIVIPHEIKIQEVVVSMAVATISFSLFFFLGKYSQTLDYEIWSGSITGKERSEGTYLRSYDCNCRDVCSGTGDNRSCSRQCDTCYERRYTVTWDAYSNIGNYRIDHLDSSSISVYGSSDPKRFTIIKNGDPVAKRVAFTNYVKAVPLSVFHNTVVEEQFKTIIPAYPDKVYDFYQLDRVVASGVDIPDLKVWNMALSALMCELGFESKANVVIVFAGTKDKAYVESLKNAWLNGKKNDVVIVFGMTQYPNIEWVDVFGWTDEELFKIQLKQALDKEKVINIYKTLDMIKEHVKSGFKYKNMEDFAYLEEAIEPPLWLIVVAVFFSIGASISAVFVMKRYA